MNSELRRTGKSALAAVAGERTLVMVTGLLRRSHCVRSISQLYKDNERDSNRTYQTTAQLLTVFNQSNSIQEGTVEVTAAA